MTKDEFVPPENPWPEDFADAIHGDWHTKPMIDLMAFVDHVVEMGVADPEALGVMGGFYGGYMTNWIIGHTDRFAAAAVRCPAQCNTSSAGRSSIGIAGPRAGLM
mgnify:CR=1 FL=1